LLGGFEFWISRQVIRKYLACITKEDSLKQILTSDLIQKDILEFQENFRPNKGCRFRKITFLKKEILPLPEKSFNSYSRIAEMGNTLS
jgi:hypothetical protein